MFIYVYIVYVYQISSMLFIKFPVIFCYFMNLMFILFMVHEWKDFPQPFPGFSNWAPSGTPHGRWTQTWTALRSPFFAASSQAACGPRHLEKTFRFGVKGIQKSMSSWWFQPNVAKTPSFWVRLVAID